MKLSRRSYAAYSISCAIVWAVILVVVGRNHRSSLHTYLLVFGGWVTGWTSATIARSVYPPPTRQRADATP